MTMFHHVVTDPSHPAHGFTPVSRDAFFEAINSLDVHPTPTPGHSRWELRNRRAVGITTPGYKWEPGPKPETRYYLNPDFLPAAKAPPPGR